MKILITGSTGLVGRHLSKRLQTEHTVVTSRSSSGLRIDVLDRNQLYHFNDLDVVIHLAARTSIVDSISNPYDTYYTNIVGTLNVLDLIKRFNIKKLINVSTFLYGIPKYLPIDERHPIKPHSPYNKSKYLAEKLCEYYAEDYKINVVTLRPFYIYGPSDNPSFLSQLIKKAINSEKVLLSNKNIRRDFIYIEDFVELVNKILLQFPRGYNVYNVGYGKSYTLEEVLKAVETIINRKIDFEYDYSLRPNDITEMVADSSKVQQRFNWRPSIDIQQGLKLTIDGYVKKINNNKS